MTQELDALIMEHSQVECSRVSRIVGGRIVLDVGNSIQGCWVVAFHAFFFGNYVPVPCHRAIEIFFSNGSGMNQSLQRFKHAGDRNDRCDCIL